MTRQTQIVRFVGFPGAAALVVAEWTPLFAIEARGEVIARVTTGPHHGYALLMLGVAAAVLTWLATRPGAVRFLGLLLLLVGAAAAFVVIAIDVPDLGRDGLFGDVDRPARSTAGIGFFLESAGAFLVLLAGAIAVVAPRGAPSDADAHR